MTEPTKSAHLIVSVRRWRRRGNFYHGIGAEILGQSPASEARMRAGKDTVILAPGNRLKLWLEHDCDGEALGWREPSDVVCEGIVKGNGDLHTAHLTPADWMRLLRNAARKPSGTDNTGAAPIDACIEGTFDSGRRDRNGHWIGTFEDLPAWMGDDVAVTIAEPDEDDCAHIVAPEVVPEDMPPWMRVNGVWMLVQPDGTRGRAGHYWLYADPHDIAAARGYDGTILPNDDTLPIRSRTEVRKLFTILYPRLGYDRPTKEHGDDYIAWRDAAKTIEYGIGGLCQAHRQARYYRIRECESANASERKNRLAQNRYARRAKAYEEYDFEAWLDETKDKYATKWVYEADRAKNSAYTCTTRAEHIEEGIATKRAEVEAAEEVAARLEAKYADLIRTMYLTHG